jgi:hypothetical protein
MSGKAIIAAWAFIFLAAAIESAGAVNLATAVTAQGNANGVVGATIGWSFTPAVDLTVTQLGVFDVDGDGLARAHGVGLWTSGGSFVVATGVPAGVAAPLTGGARFVDIAPVTLSAGTSYVIGAYYVDSTDTWLTDGILGNELAYHPALAAGAGRTSGASGSLGFPATAVGLPRVGPTFAFTLPPPVTRVWPNRFDPPCNLLGDLAACIADLNFGDVIAIEANAIPGQSITVSPAKSFTLRSSLGFTPVFDDSTSIALPGSPFDVTVVIRGLTFARASLRAFGGSGALDLTVRDNVFQRTSDTLGGVLVTERTGPTVLRLENNEITVEAGAAFPVAAIYVAELAGAGNVAGIRGNRIGQSGINEANGIQVYGRAMLDLDVIGNDIRASNFNYGIGVFPDGPGPVAARIVNNVVTGQQDGAGGPGALALHVDGGHADFAIVNNTLSGNDTGLSLGGRPDLGATATALIANNIVAFNARGMNLQAFEAMSANEFNLVHGNSADLYTPGPGTLTADPQFVTPADLRLQAGSPAENSGSSGRVPPDVTTDIAGNARVQGIVDRGAWEMVAGGSDQDGDGIADELDNCVLVANVDQRDTNGDAYGNLCDGDLDDSGFVNFADLALFRAVFGTVDPHADFDGSGLANFADLARFRTMFGSAPGPSGYH